MTASLLSIYQQLHSGEGVPMRVSKNSLKLFSRRQEELEQENVPLELYAHYVFEKFFDWCRDTMGWRGIPANIFCGKKAWQYAVGAYNKGIISITDTSAVTHIENVGIAMEVISAYILDGGDNYVTITNTITELGYVGVVLTYEVVDDAVKELCDKWGIVAHDVDGLWKEYWEKYG